MQPTEELSNAEREMLNIQRQLAERGEVNRVLLITDPQTNKQYELSHDFIKEKK